MARLLARALRGALYTRQAPRGGAGGREGGGSGRLPHQAASTARWEGTSGRRGLAADPGPPLPSPAPGQQPARSGHVTRLAVVDPSGCLGPAHGALRTAPVLYSARLPCSTPRCLSRAPRETLSGPGSPVLPTSGRLPPLDLYLWPWSSPFLLFGRWVQLLLFLLRPGHPDRASRPARLE